jgi:outer membrane protein OmpA-like peptidoglycan-associated protein
MIRTIFALFILISSLGFSQKAFVYFKFNKHDLSQKGKETIDSVLKISNIEKIYLQGHCDSIGSHNYNDLLSTKRVNEVRAYILSKNFPESLIEIKCLGKRVALNKNMNEQERALNRRVEIEMVLKPTVVAKPKDTVKTVSKTPVAKNEIEVMINGIILNEKKEPLIAEVTLSDKNGNELKTVQSGKDGKYNFKAVLNKKEDYNLTFYNDSSFVSAKQINASNPRVPYKNLRTILPILKGGTNYVLENLNFEGDTSQLIAASLPSLEALYKVMKKNKQLVIRIEGHVNFPHHWGNPKGIKAKSHRYVPPGMNYEQFNQWLSDDRAKAVYSYLVKKGIDPNRMSTIGYGASKMLYPDTQSETEMALNRRVEISVISVK